MGVLMRNLDKILKRNQCKYYLYGKTRYTISCSNKKIKKRELLDNISGFCPYCHRQIYIIDFI